MSKPVVLIAEELSPATLAVLGTDFDIRHCNGADRAELLPALAEANAVLVRSATKIDAEAFAAAPQLQVVARAGVGLDNVDVKAATKAGVMVVNAPTSNITSASELAVGLLIACARHIAPANQALKAGTWARSKYTGVELFDKTVGVIGLGRIGQLTAERLAGFGMRVIAYDPYVSTARAGQLGVKLVSLDDLLTTSDFITVHLPKTQETLGLIGAEALSKVKPTVRIINAARGGIVDEDALAQALTDGRVAGAGLDVYSKEPCTDSPLFAFDNVVVTPHLGASTDEAQEKAGIAVAHSVRRALAGELVPDAVNVSGGAIHEDVRPGIPLVEKLGRIFTGLAGAIPTQLDVEVHGELAANDVSVFQLAALKGLFQDVVQDGVSYVNAPLLAADRDVQTRIIVDDITDGFRTTITLRGTLPDGEQLRVSGALTGPRRVQKLVGVGRFEMEIPISEHMLFYAYDDRPGVIGIVGQLLGQAQVNIAGMQVARDDEAADCVVVLTVDSEVPTEVVGRIEGAIGAKQVAMVDLTEH